ncbi:hypothetical protein SLI_7823 [Streptomyces lividans 1326]|uniref:Uncharacterized protein n=1 Tax=Streptomyces lividans 1326 TaxID=1200984 RepID=A0A7U9E2N2_STRLI|nr:hypothetical protein SLI_7823 [Streptomyces lividans 1326]
MGGRLPRSVKPSAGRIEPEGQKSGARGGAGAEYGVPARARGVIFEA